MGRRIERDFGWLSATALLAALLWSGCAEDGGPERAARARLDGELDGSVEGGVDGGLMDAGPAARRGGVAEIAAPPPPGCFPQSCTLPSGCPGRRTCTNGTYLGPCVPLSTTTDTTCNGLDDNCNGMIDEDATAASCNDGRSCTIDSCNMTTHACVNQPFGQLCTTGISDCTIGICTNAAGVSNAEFAFTAADPLVVPTGVPAALGCTYRARNNWCTNTYDSCNCNGPEICVARPRLGAGGVAGCVSAPFAAPGPIIYAACDNDGIACTNESACCEPAGGGYCRTDFLMNPTLLERRLAACDAPGGMTDAWLPVPGFPPLGGATAAANLVICSPVNPFGTAAAFTNRCQNDGNPCTTITCNETAGGTCTLTNPTGLAPPETYLDATGTLVSGTRCSGDVTGTGGCSRYTCDGAGACTTRPTTAPGGTTIDCGGTGPGRPPRAGDDLSTCAVPRCMSGTCNTEAFAPTDSSTCPAFPPSCGSGPPACVPTATSTYDPDVPDGCQPPAGFCFFTDYPVRPPLPLPPDGVISGTCVPEGWAVAPSGDLSCRGCAPGVSPWQYSNLPAGTDCTAFSVCIINETCNGSGQCVGITDTANPACRVDG
jgi:hypothetical protein